MIVDSAAAGLLTGDDDIAAIFLQDASGGPVNVAKHGVGHAADEQGYFCAFWSFCRQELGQFRQWCAQSGELGLHALQSLGQEFGQSQGVESFVESEGLHPARGAQGPCHSFS